MTKYNVHIYREMRILYQDITAETPEAAAEACRDFPSHAGCYPVDCDCQTFAAIVDTQGDSRSKGKSILFEEGKLRRDAPAQALILDLVRYGLMDLSDGQAYFDDVDYWFDDNAPDWTALVNAIGWNQARAAIEQARALPDPQWEPA